MRQFRADLHIHTVLSPCGDLEMSPTAIVKIAKERNLDIIGVADHNSTKHGPLIKKLAEKVGMTVICGAEVTTREETHCLAFFENMDSLDQFQKYLDGHLPNIKSDPKLFGYQVVVDEDEMIVEEVDRLLISAIDQNIDQVEEMVHSLGGIFIPAHIDRQRFSLISQLGFVPPALKADAFEISKFTTPEKILKLFPYLKNATFLRNSDAHYIKDVGSSYTIFEMETASFDEIKLALAHSQGRGVITEFVENQKPKAS